MLEKRAGEGLLTKVCSDRTQTNDFKLNENGLRLGIRKQFW